MGEFELFEVALLLIVGATYIMVGIDTHFMLVGPHPLDPLGGVTTFVYVIDILAWVAIGFAAIVMLKDTAGHAKHATWVFTGAGAAFVLEDVINLIVGGFFWPVLVKLFAAVLFLAWGVLVMQEAEEFAAKRVPKYASYCLLGSSIFLAICTLGFTIVLSLGTMLVLCIIFSLLFIAASAILVKLAHDDYASIKGEAV